IRTSSSVAIRLMARDLAKYRGLATTGCWRTSDNARFVSFFHYIRQYMSYKIERCCLRLGMVNRNSARKRRQRQSNGVGPTWLWFLTKLAQHQSNGVGADPVWKFRLQPRA